ncbi:hypothetical protein F2P81_021435 [Scophthalmus maximus]|uniref:Uncharacterized protein n=1 Tax=Scophthalmus maximus TaxID=52904 RepID=A0A6A4S3G1_SCOMX|nr:hypothetical protein F2P81_021435 [Scophthalmus maximus]
MPCAPVCSDSSTVEDPATQFTDVKWKMHDDADDEGFKASSASSGSGRIWPRRALRPQRCNGARPEDGIVDERDDRKDGKGGEMQVCRARMPEASLIKDATKDVTGGPPAARLHKRRNTHPDEECEFESVLAIGAN